MGGPLYGLARVVGQGRGNANRFQKWGEKEALPVVAAAAAGAVTGGVAGGAVLALGAGGSVGIAAAAGTMQISAAAGAVAGAASSVEAGPRNQSVREAVDKGAAVGAVAGAVVAVPAACDAAAKCMAAPLAAPPIMNGKVDDPEEEAGSETEPHAHPVDTVAPPLIQKVDWRNETVSSASYYQRELGSGKDSGPGHHHGVVVNTKEGNSYLIHHPGPDQLTTVTQASDMSHKWTKSHDIPIKSSPPTVEQVFKGSGGRTTNTVVNYITGGTCIGVAKTAESVLQPTSTLFGDVPISGMRLAVVPR